MNDALTVGTSAVVGAITGFLWAFLDRKRIYEKGYMNIVFLFVWLFAAVAALALLLLFAPGKEKLAWLTFAGAIGVMSGCWAVIFYAQNTTPPEKAPETKVPEAPPPPPVKSVDERLQELLDKNRTA